jgi:PKD repeat protein
MDFNPKRNLLVWLLLILTFGAYGQSTFQAELVPDFSAQELDEQFTSYQVFDLDMNSVHTTVISESFDSKLRLVIGDIDWTMQIVENSLRSPEYTVTYTNAAGETVVGTPSPVSTYKGQLANYANSHLRLTIRDDLLYGSVRENSTIYNIEPVHYFVEGTAKDRYVIYRDQDVRPTPEKTCGVDETTPIYQLRKEQNEKNKAGEEAPNMMQCREVELAIAHDKHMFDKKGSVAACEGHGEAIMNLVAGDWDDQFFYLIEFIIVTQHVETSNINWPTSSNNAGTVLTAFRNWGNSGGFNANYDLGQLWTARNFTGGTVGIAYLSAVCSANRYHAMQDYTSNTNQLRCVTSHEIGHNFSCTHDSPGAPFIMAPSVSGSSVWSNQSVSQVNNYTPSAGCLNICFNGSPPQAAFTANPQVGCVPMVVQFTDQSTGPPDSWFWEFPGGTPSTSTQQNPLVTYHNSGVYDVSLQVTNLFGQSNSYSPGMIVVNDLPDASFFYIDDQKVVSFNNTSQFANHYTWDFGDGYTLSGQGNATVPPNTHGGRTSGTYANPVHRYDKDGFYLVILTAVGDCGASTYADQVEVVSEVTADFVSNIQEVCAPLEVEFYDNSSENVQIWLWEFPGGTPRTSTDPNPVVTYDSAGTYDVILEVANTRYSDNKIRKKYIMVDTVPIAYFGDSTVNLTVHFKDSAYLARKYKWYFGDGDSSTLRKPIHTYDLDTTYLVTQIVENFCGFDTFELFVPVGALPDAGFSATNYEGCPPLDVQFSDSSTPNTTRWYWTFTGGNPASSREQNPLVRYESSGSYPVQLIAENGLGRDTIMINNYVVAEEIPEPDFAFTRMGYQVNFDNMSEFANTYFWDFGDGNTSTQENPTHTYQADGTYTVALEATNNCGSEIKIIQITVSNRPSAAFRANAKEGCVPFEVEFENLSSNNAQGYNWTFPGGNPGSSTLENPSVTYAASGIYNVTLIATNANGSDTIVEPMYIRAKDVPAVDFSQMVSGNQVNLTNTTANGTSYMWSFGDGNSSTEENPAHTFAENGNYSVQLTATNECGSKSVTKSVVITAYPAADFIATELIGCVPFEVQFQDNSTQATAWEWTFENGNPASSTEEDPIVTYSERGTYTVTLKATNNYGSDATSKTGYITVLDSPIANFTSLVNGQKVQFTDNSIDATIYEWNFGDGNTSNKRNPEHEYEEDGEYTVTLTVTNICGTHVSTRTVRIVDNTPGISISSSSTTGCVPFDVQFQDNSSNDPTEWNWTFDGGEPASANIENPRVRYSEPGVYDVVLEVSNQFGTSVVRFEQYITSLDVPEADFDAMVQGSIVRLTNNSNFGTVYQWSFGDGTTSTEENPIYNYNATGDFEITLIATNQCGSDTTRGEVSIRMTNTVQKLGLNTFSLYPNPNNGSFNIQITGAQSDEAEFTLIDLLGRPIYTAKATAIGGNLQSEINAGNVAAGTYYLRVRMGNLVAHEKLIIQN